MIDDRSNTESSDIALTANYFMLTENGLVFDLFVDSAEGSALPLDSERVKVLADHAVSRLVEHRPDEGPHD